MLMTNFPFFFLFFFLFSGKGNLRPSRLAALKIHRQENDVVLLRKALFLQAGITTAEGNLEWLEFHITTQFLLDVLGSAC